MGWLIALIVIPNALLILGGYFIRYLPDPGPTPLPTPIPNPWPKPDPKPEPKPEPKSHAHCPPGWFCS